MKPVSIHPQIERLAAESAAEMGCAVVAGILNVSYDTVKRLASGDNPQISCQVVKNARKVSEEERAKRGTITARRNTKDKERRTFTKLDVLAYIVRSTTGDRSFVFKAVEQLMPAYLPLAQEAASNAHLPAWLREQHQQQTPPAKLPRNVLRMKPAADPHANHPDLFADLSTSKAG